MDDLNLPGGNDVAVPDPVPHWLKGQGSQNYGDFLSQFLVERLFEVTLPGRLRVIGSCLADKFVPDEGEVDGPIVFWGCGARDAHGMSEAALSRVEIRSVRGPLTRSALRLGASIPIGDPGLLLPLLHQAAAPVGHGPGAVLVPHFIDMRHDQELLSISACDAVLRPNLAERGEDVLDFIDAITRARFVLAGSLHAAITACAYGVPFAFWDSGNIDVPFKWDDFGRSIGIECAFHRRLAEAEQWFASEVARALTIPPLWPMLAAAPLPVRPAMMLATIRGDVERHGIDVLAAFEPPRRGSALIAALARTLQETERRPTDPSGARARAQLRAMLDEARGRLELAEMRAAREAGGRGTAEAEAQAAREAAGRAASREAEARAAIEALRHPTRPPLTPYEFSKMASFTEKLENENERLALRVRALGLELENAERTVVQAAGSPVVQALEQNLAALRAEHELVLRSTVWRVGRRLGALADRQPGLARHLRRTAKFAWWIATGRIGARLRAREQMHHAIRVLVASRLFDPAYYMTRHAGVVPPGTDAVMHYLWVGAASGLDPHPLFDTSWYASQMPAGSTANPLVHYLEGTGTIDPHPLFDQAFYLARAGAPPGPGETALAHYLTTADADATAPNAVFDPRAYLIEYPDAASHPGGALLHYVESGEARGLRPHPLFDPAYYVAAHPEAAALGPLGHYLRVGRAANHAGSAIMAELGIPALPHDPAFVFADAPDVSVIIPTYGHLFETIRCLAAVQARTGALAVEVIVADDRPHAPIAPALPQGGGLAVHVNDRNLGFLRSCNAAARRARGRLLVFLNNDTIVDADWLRPMVAALASDARIGMVGCKLLNPDGTIQEAGGIIHSNGWGFPYGLGDDPARGAYNAVRDVDVVTGACFLVRRDLFARLGGFDDRYAPAFYEEFDLATALRDAGYRVVYQPASVVVHHGSASYGREERDRQSKRNHAKFCAKWRTLLARQPVEGDPLFLVRERPSPRGVILVIDDKVPEYDKHAGAVTLFQYLNLMVELGLKVVFHPQDGQPLQPYTAVLQQRGIEIVHAPDTLADWLAENGRHVDFVWTARPYVTAPILDLIRRTTGAPLLYYTHDLHYLREMRRYELDGDAWAREESERLKPMELGIFAAVDIVMTPSTEEARIIAAEVPDARVAVVPPYLFADTQAIDPAALDFAARRDVLFVGGFDHTPNVDAALFLVRDIMPLVWARAPATRAMIVGHAPPADVRALANDRVEVTGFVPSIDPYFDRARVSVNPLRYGAGVKGKIVSALQAGVPVVTTGCGNEGIQLRHGTEALIGETASEIADAILRLLDDAALCGAMSQAGAAVVRERFSATRARRVLRGLLGDDLCPVCGTRPRHARPATDGAWEQAIACTTCHASDRDAAIVHAVLAPFHRYGVASIREARPRLADLRIHISGRAEALERELAGLSSPDIPDAGIDLLISLDLPVDAALADRVVRPGGRVVFAASTASDPLAGELRARGFTVALSTAQDAPLAVFEAVRSP